MESEIWKPIKGYEGLYEISNLGTIKTLHNRYKGKIYLKAITDRFGYLAVYLYKNKSRKRVKIHRIVAENFIPNDENKPFVNHIDGNKQNNNVSNLEWCTCAENNLHACKTGLAAGHKSYNSKLSEEDVLFIRNNYVPYSITYGATALSKKFSINRENILKIIHGDSYKLDGGKIHDKFEVDKETKEYVIKNYIPYDKSFGLSALSRKFNLSVATINKMVGSMEVRISKEDAIYIKENYKPRDKNFGCRALSEKFGVCTRTIYKIVSEKIKYSK